MRNRKLATGGVLAVVFGAGLAASVLPGSAGADPRTLVVTLATGQTITVTVDVPPGTPVDQIKIPGVSTPIVGVSEVPQSPPPTDTTPAPGPQPPVSATVQATPDAPTAPPQDSSGQAPQQQAQQQTGKTKRKAHAKVKGATGTVQQTLDRAKRDAKSHTRAQRAPDGAPTPDNPTFSLALPGPAPIGVPNFFIEKFRIPPFLLPIYQAAGIEYGIRWEVLAAINEIETDYGRNLNVSTAGAVGWMQFLPSTWKKWGVDANRDHVRDPYNPVDAIFSAARYLKAAGAADNLHRAIFAYNHADWYVDSVLLRARLIGGLPADFVGSLTGLTEGRFPVYGKATYADDLNERAALRRMKRGENAAVPVEARSNRRSIDVFAKRGTPVVAVQDGKVIRMGSNKRLGRFLMLRDAYGNTYTYGHLAKLATEYPVPKPAKESATQVSHELHLPKKDAAPTAPATAGRQVLPTPKPKELPKPKPAAAPTSAAAEAVAAPQNVAKERLFANPSRPEAFHDGGRQQILDMGGTVSAGTTTFKNYFTGVFGLKRKDVVIKRLKTGSQVIAGTILGRIGQVGVKTAPHVMFEIRPAGRGAPRIDPKPILDGWKLLESTAIYRAKGMNPFYGANSGAPSVGQVLLMSKDALQRRVLNDPNVDIYDCGRRDIEAGSVDRRVMATLEFLSASGLKPTVTSIRCGHSLMTTSGNVSEHSTGDAVDVAKINGIPVLGHQGPGSITDITVRRLLTLQGVMKPHQIITLMAYPNADNTLALPDHNDHIHVGFAPLTGSGAQKFNSILKPGQWDKLIQRLGTLQNPTVALRPSKYAIKVGGSSSGD